MYEIWYVTAEQIKDQKYQSAAWDKEVFYTFNKTEYLVLSHVMCDLYIFQPFL